MPDLHLDVYVAPMKPMRGAPARGPGDDPMWSPMSSTLIHGEQDAVLVDTLVAFDQVDALADWVQGFGKRLTAIYITHGHADHWIGLSRLLERFPDARALAALEPRIVVSGHKRVGAADDPKTIGESQQYLRDFSRVVASEPTVEGIVSAMMELHPDRDNPRVVWHSAREAVKKRPEA